MLALLAPLLRRRDVRAAALAGAAIALAATPFTAPGVPILLAAAGVLVARFVPAGARMTWWAIFALAAGTYVCKAAGPIALGSRTVPPPLQRALTLLSVTLLSGPGRDQHVRRRPRAHARRPCGRAGGRAAAPCGCARRSPSS